METICSINANSDASYIVVPSRQHEDRISDFETDSRYWGSGHYCVQGDLIVWIQSHEQFVG